MFNSDGEVVGSVSSERPEREAAAVAPVAIEVSRHAALRYGERVRSAVHREVGRARTEIELLVRTGTPQSDPPPWMLSGTTSYEAGREYVMLGPDVAFVVQPGQGADGRVTLVVTVMTPWDQGACHRADRRQRRAELHRRLHPPHPPSTRPPRRSDDAGDDADDRLAVD